MADLRALVAGFLVEASEICESITRDALKLERTETRGDVGAAGAAVDRIARGLHTLKGTAATLELDEPSTLAHELESLIPQLREAIARGDAGGDVVGALLTGLDRYLEMVRATSVGADDAASAPLPSRPRAEVDEDTGWRVQSRDVLALLRDIERMRELQQKLAERRRSIEMIAASLAKIDARASAPARELLAALATGLKSDAADAGDIVDDLEAGVKTICTEPARVVLQPLARAVRDLCAAQGKEARLSTVGGEISVDRRVLEALRAPLVHMVRNAVDHGVEMPEEREAAGKHREASIVIRLEQQGNMLFLEISDDGRGIDVEALRAAAKARGTADVSDDAAAMQLVFRPGFSTKSRVTETSGRGVGLDVVKSEIEAIHGRVEVQSKRSEGARFVLTIPAEIGSSPCLLVRVAEHVLALPLLAVAHATGFKPVAAAAGATATAAADIADIADIVDAGALIGVRQSEAPSSGQPVLRVESGARSLHLLVDEVVGERELVIRPLPSEIAEARAYQGAATLAHGEIVLVVRPDWLVEAGLAHDRSSGGGVALARRALVVDDSLTARALHRSMLEAGGFIVHAVAGARQALAQLSRNTYDVVVADIQMPEMDGYELTASIKAARYDAPIILVTSGDGDDSAARARAAGADGFLTKRECAAGGLLDHVRVVLGARAAP